MSITESMIRSEAAYHELVGSRLPALHFFKEGLESILTNPALNATLIPFVGRMYRKVQTPTEFIGEFDQTYLPVAAERMMRNWFFDMIAVMPPNQLQYVMRLICGQDNIPLPSKMKMVFSQEKMHFSTHTCFSQLDARPNHSEVEFKELVAFQCIVPAQDVEEWNMT